MNNNEGEDLISFHLEAGNVFKPLDGTSCLGLRLKNNSSDKTLIFNVTPTRPDIFIVSPDYGELHPLAEKTIQLEILHGFTTFVWAKDASSHPFTLTVRELDAEKKGIIQTSQITTEVDTRNGREGVKALTKAVSALQSRIQEESKTPERRYLKHQNSGSDPETARKLRQENRQLLNEVNILTEEEKNLNSRVRRLRDKLEWREATDTGKIGENGKQLVSPTP